MRFLPQGRAYRLSMTCLGSSVRSFPERPVDLKPALDYLGGSGRGRHEFDEGNQVSRAARNPDGDPPGRLVAFAVSSFGANPKVDEPMIAVAGAASSALASMDCLISNHSGSFSWMKSALLTASSKESAKCRRSIAEVLSPSPVTVRLDSTWARNRPSAPSAGSKAVTVTNQMS